MKSRVPRWWYHPWYHLLYHSWPHRCRPVSRPHPSANADACVAPAGRIAAPRPVLRAGRWTSDGGRVCPRFVPTLLLSSVSLSSMPTSVFPRRRRHAPQWAMGMLLPWLQQHPRVVPAVALRITVKPCHVIHMLVLWSSFYIPKNTSPPDPSKQCARTFLRRSTVFI